MQRAAARIDSRAKGKVCILTTAHTAFDTRIFHKEAKTLVSAGYSVTLIAQHKSNETVEGVQILALSTPSGRFHRMFGLTWRAFWLALRQRVAVYHLHDPELLLVGIALRVLTRRRVIYDVHELVKVDVLDKGWLPVPLRRPVGLLYQAVECASGPFMSAIVLAEDSYLPHYKGPKVCTVRNYPLLDEAKGEATGPPRRTGNRAVYVGRVARIRGAMEMIEALHLIHIRGYHDFILTIVGGVDPELENEMRQLSSSYGLEPYVRIVGQVPYPEIWEYLRESDVGLALLHPTPNVVDSAATKLFEYMLAGLPVIASNFPLWKQIVEDNGCGLNVDAQDVQKIFEAIVYLLENPDIRLRMGENGWKAVHAKYAWEAEARKLLSCYSAVLKRRSDRG